MKRSTVVEVVAFALMLLYAYTASSKFLEYSTFTLLTKFLPLINKIPGSMLWILPSGEMLMIIALATKKFRLIGFYSVVIVTAASIIYRIIILSGGKHLPCLCGPYLRSMGEVRHVFFDMAILVAAFGAILLSRRRLAKRTIRPEALGFTQK